MELVTKSAVNGAQRLREMLAAPGTIRIAGAHNPLGARIAERVGFDGVWSSGLEISASQGLPDTDLLTMSELLSVAAPMAAAVDIPVVADCDAGYGNALNVMHMVRRYESAGIAGVSIEDKVFPKVNSFVSGRQELCPIDEFCGKVEAAKAARRGTDLVVIARIEALIAGHGLDEALCRGEAYAEAGADAVVIHAKGTSPQPVLEFLRRWRLDLPVVVIPTTYHTITAAELGAAGAKMVIYANHGLRAGINAVTETFETILRDGRSTGVEERIAPLATVFDLQGVATVLAAEQRFVRTDLPAPRVVVVPAAACRDDTDGDVLAALRTAVVRDAGMTAVAPLDDDADVAATLADVPSEFRGRTLVGAHDVIVDAELLRRLANSAADVTVLADLTESGADAEPAGCVPVALASTVLGGRRFGGRHGHLVTAFGGRRDAGFVPVAAFSPAGFAALREAAEKRGSGPDTGATTLAQLLADLVDVGWPVRAVGVAGGWAEVRSPDDLLGAHALLSDQVTA